MPGNMNDAITEAIHQAVKDASTRGWEAIILVLVMLGVIALFGLIVRWLMRSMDNRLKDAREREDRMCKRIDLLEDFQNTTLVDLVKTVAKTQVETIDAVRSLKNALDKRLCILDPARQDEALDRLGDRLAERAADNQREIALCDQKS